MWSGEPALAHDLITDQGRQWSARTASLDGVIGPGPAAEFIASYAERVGNAFRPRTLVVGHELVAYTWDVSKRDGSIVTGLDFNVLHEGRVVDNWTFAGPWRSADEDGPGSGSLTADDLAELVVHDAQRRGVDVHRRPALDPDRQTVAYLCVTEPDQPGGLDIAVLHDGEVPRRWSVPAYRPFLY